MHNSCNAHSGQSEKINSIESRMTLITWLLGILIGLIVTLNTGVIVVLWSMNGTISILNAKISIYDKIFEAKLEGTKHE